MFRLTALIAGLLLVAGCDMDRPPGGEAYPLPEGLHADVIVNDRTYDMTVTAVDGPQATLQYRWKQRLVAERVQYRGLFTLSGLDGDSAFVNEVDTSLIEAAFPLEVGDTLRFPGVLRLPEQGTVAPFRVTMEVVGESQVTLMGAAFDVLDIRIAIETMRGGDILRQMRELSYSPELGLPLKMRIREDGAQADWRIDRIDIPARGRRNRLGTVMI